MPFILLSLVAELPMEAQIVLLILIQIIFVLINVNQTGNAKYARSMDTNATISANNNMR